MKKYKIKTSETFRDNAEPFGSIIPNMVSINTQLRPNESVVKKVSYNGFEEGVNDKFSGYVFTTTTIINKITGKVAQTTDYESINISKADLDLRVNSTQERLKLDSAQVTF